MMIVDPKHTNNAKGAWSRFLALCDRLIGRAGMIPFLTGGGMYLGGLARVGQHFLSAAICALVLACASYFVVRIGRSNRHHAFNVGLFVLFFGGFGFGIGILSPY